MAIEVKIHEINTLHNECIITIIDNGVTILDNKNIGIQLKEDGSADFDWISNVVKQKVSNIRLNNEQRLLVHTDKD